MPEKKTPEPTNHPAWPILAGLAAALEPTWHEAHTAGRARRHNQVIRDVAHELSNSPERDDRPKSAAEAQARFDEYLDRLADTPRTGLSLATADFIDDLSARAQRYGAHLFVCFDDPRIPATTNGLEGFFGRAKHTLRRALGGGSTTNSVASNLGADVLIAYQHVQRPERRSEVRVPTGAPADFFKARARIAAAEQPAIARRSKVRHLRPHIKRLRQEWLAPPPMHAGP